MFFSRTSVALSVSILLCFTLLMSCGSTSTTQRATKKLAPTSTVSVVTPTATIHQTTSALAPTRYTQQVIFRGGGRPDDLAFDRQGRILFSDPHNGTISRVNLDGTGQIVLWQGLGSPEGMIVLSDGTIMLAEQKGHQILSLTPGHVPTLLRKLPGIPSTALCKDGVDGIAFDPTTNTLIVPDSPIGNVYRMSLDGKQLTLLASGMIRPVGATVDAHGNIYVADECGGALWRITPQSQITRIGGFGMLDDVSLDQHGNALVTDLEPAIHALIRMNLTNTNDRVTLASKGFIEPQGLLIDAHDNIFVSDDFANSIVEYRPV